MKSFEERREEIFRRSDERIRKRTVRRKTLAMCVPLVCGAVVLGAALTPRLLAREDGGGASTYLETGSDSYLEAGSAGADGTGGGAPTNEAALLADSAAVREEIRLITGDPANRIPQAEISEVPVPEGGGSYEVNASAGGEDESSAVASHRTNAIPFTIPDGADEKSYLLDPDGGLLYDLTAEAVYRVPAERLEALRSLLEGGN